ncbi:hypothetical protein GH714_007188 [Hevea brasiliensis]|uniref:RING-type E3 ubiquitin transferase n=1 Tax=Hevea brasiliensis TaxID=3981 RepID=A0A6A6M934_HEVBR|nr:hypothetical protein GH714_007188 [Hevea brasiliensis]
MSQIMNIRVRFSLISARLSGLTLVNFQIAINFIFSKNRKIPNPLSDFEVSKNPEALVFWASDGSGREGGRERGGGSSLRDETEIVQDILNLIESVAQLGDCQRTYKKDCCGLVRGMKLLWPLLEEIRDCNEPISERCVSCLTNLKKAFLVAKKLLKVCNEGSKISLVVESKAFMMKFRTINEKLCQAVEGLPFDELGISDEMKEQIIGMEAADVLDNPVMPKSLEKCTSLVIPLEFLCPITLEIMTDPVIIASGQTYERESIEKWFNSNRTCTKTRQTLAHQLVITNYALKNLILQWCEENKFHLPKKANCPSSESSSDHSEDICSLVRGLSSSHLEMQRKAVKKIRMLSKENSENRILIASNVGILPLVQILSYPDSKIQEHSVTALLNLSIDETNKRLIAKGGGIPAIVEVLQHESREARENSAAALFSLSMLDENKMSVGLSNGIPPLVDLLQNRTVRDKRDAAAALSSLSLNHSNKARAALLHPYSSCWRTKTWVWLMRPSPYFYYLCHIPRARVRSGSYHSLKSL